jgi:hypothetical protein
LKFDESVLGSSHHFLQLCIGIVKMAEVVITKHHKILADVTGDLNIKNISVNTSHIQQITNMEERWGKYFGLKSLKQYPREYIITLGNQKLGSALARCICF